MPKASALPDNSDELPNLDEDQFQPIDDKALFDAPRSIHKPRVLMLYGSLRERSYSRLVTEEAARILRRFGAEVRIYNPSGLPLPDSTGPDHPKVKELRDLSMWSEAHVRCSPERHGAMTGIWMRMVTIPNQSSVAKAFAEFDEARRMKPSAY